MRGILEPSNEGALFRLGRHGPALDLRHALDRHWTVAWDLRGRPPFAQEIVNHPNVNLSFEPDGAFVWGVGTTRTRHELRDRGWVLGTRFRPGGFRPFAGRPVAELTDRIVPLAELFGRADAGALEARVRGERETAARIAHVEAFLRARSDGPDPRVADVAGIVGLLLDEPSITRVGQLAARCHLSPRTLQRLFHDYVGVSPKWVVRRQRLHTAAERIAEQPQLDLGALAVDVGYFDQAHFINEFKAVVGRTPADYAAACAVAAAATVAA
jgi:AraC-like DNA-binding protein